MLAKKETIQQKENKEGTNDQANVIHDKQRTKTHQQRQLTQCKLLPNPRSCLDGLVVSYLDFETRNLNSLLAQKNLLVKSLSMMYIRGDQVAKKDTIERKNSRRRNHLTNKS